MEDQKLQWGYHQIEIKWEYDEDPDVSWLVGKCTDNRDEYVFDRREGILLGEYVEQTLTLKYNRIPGRKMVKDVYSRSGKSPSSETWAYAEKFLEDEAQTLNISQDDDNFIVHWDSDDKEFYLEVSGNKILAQDLGNYIHRNNEYRYVYATENHLPHNPESWKNVSLADMDGESFEAADIRYAVEDYLRWERFNLDYWSMMGCIVTLYKDNVEVEESSCWGIESDGGKEYHEEMIRELLGDVLHRYGIDIPAETVLKEAKEWEEEYD